MDGSIVFATWRQCGGAPHLTHAFVSPSESTLQTASRSVQPFLYSSRRVSLYFTMDRPFPLKTAPCMGESGPPFNTWFLVPTQVHRSNSISISSAIFAGFTTVTDEETDRPRYSVCSNRPHLHRVSKKRPAFGLL